MTLPRFPPVNAPRGSSIAWLDRERWLAALLGLGAIPAGVLVGLHPLAVVVLAAICALLAICAVTSMRHLPALLLGATIVMPTLVFEGISGSGQARAVVAVLILGFARVLLAKPKIPVPGPFALALAAGVGLTLATAVVALGRPAGQVGTVSELVRDLSFPFAAVVGLLGGAQARRSGRGLAIPRSFAGLGILACIVCIDYWAWAKHGGPPLSGGLFSQVQSSTGFVGRSVFPLVEDAPNLNAVMLMMLAAFCGPPLLLARGRGDRVLAMALLLTAVGAVLATQSRTGLIAAMAGSVTYVALLKRAGRPRAAVVITLLLLAAAGGYVVSTFPPERLTGDTLQSRVLIWKQAARSFVASPVIGHGYLYSEAGNFEETAAPTGTTVSKTTSTHDDLLSALVDGGVVGGAVFVGILGLMLRCGLRALRDERSNSVATGYCCMLVVLLVSGIDNATSQSAAVVTLEWLTFGIVAGLAPQALTSRARAGYAPPHEAPSVVV